MAGSVSYNDNVFINCPFDDDYKPLYEATIFAIIDCGFTPRCALEENDAGNIRIEKIYRLIDDCKFGIHDISMAGLDPITNLARFNMPFELGLFFGAKRYAAATHRNKNKKILVMDSEQARYQQFISDLLGYDIAEHHQDLNTLVTKVRNFLANHTERESIAGGAYIAGRLQLFLQDLPGYCQTAHWHREHLSFLEFVSCIEVWIEENPIT